MSVMAIVVSLWGATILMNLVVFALTGLLMVRAVKGAVRLSSRMMGEFVDLHLKNLEALRRLERKLEENGDSIEDGFEEVLAQQSANIDKIYEILDNQYFKENT